MYIERVPNRNSPPAVLLRESYREGKKVRKRTLANLSKLPDEAVDGLKILLKGGKAIEDIEEGFNIVRSRPHGHVAAVLGTIKKIGLDSIISSENTRNRRLVLSMIAARIIAPKSKLATARGLQEATKLSSIGELLGLSGTDEDELTLWIKENNLGGGQGNDYTSQNKRRPERKSRSRLDHRAAVKPNPQTG